MSASQLFSGNGDPNGVVFGNPGDVYQDQTGGAASTFWTKESGVGTNTGWVASGSNSLLALYGTGENGDYTTAGNETWTTVAGAPGSPVIPPGEPFPFAFFNNLTISAGDSVTVGGTTNIPTERAVVIFVKETLTIGAGARIHANGTDGTSAVIAGHGEGRNAIIGSAGGADGGDGATGSVVGAPGQNSNSTPAFAWATEIGGAGGAGNLNAGGAGGQGNNVSWPYSLSQAISIASLLFAIGGGQGGGAGGSESASSVSGSGGGGGGTLVIFARRIVAPAGSIQCKGGNGGNGISTEGRSGGGGGGGTGGMILIVTDNLSIVGISDASGGTGGLGAGPSGVNGANGGPGEIVAFNPMFGVLTP